MPLTALVLPLPIGPLRAVSLSPSSRVVSRCWQKPFKRALIKRMAQPSSSSSSSSRSSRSSSSTSSRSSSSRSSRSASSSRSMRSSSSSSLTAQRTPRPSRSRKRVIGSLLGPPGRGPDPLVLHLFIHLEGLLDDGPDLALEVVRPPQPQCRGVLRRVLLAGLLQVPLQALRALGRLRPLVLPVLPVRRHRGEEQVAAVAGRGLDPGLGLGEGVQVLHLNDGRGDVLRQHPPVRPDLGQPLSNQLVELGLGVGLEPVQRPALQRDRPEAQVVVEVDEVLVRLLAY